MVELSSDQAMDLGHLKAIYNACFFHLPLLTAARGGQLQVRVPVCPGLLHLPSPGPALVELLLWLFCPPDIFMGDLSSVIAYPKP